MSELAPLAGAAARLCRPPGRPRKAAVPAVVVEAVPPRLLSIKALADYISVRERMARELIASGMIPRVRVPLANGGELRRCLVDRCDVDRLVEAWKDRSVEAAP